MYKSINQLVRGCVFIDARGFVTRTIGIAVSRSVVNVKQVFGFLPDLRIF